MFDIVILLKTLGYLGLFGIVFADTGLLIGFFLPGDSLLFTAGFLAYAEYFSLYLVFLFSFVAAVLGEMAGYWLGKKYGNKVFSKKDSIFFNQNYVKKSEEFFKKHGRKTIILARFVPIVRTAVPILAGMGSMHYRIFFIYNLIGGALWTIGLSAFGYYFGKIVPNADHYILPIIGLIIFVSILPSAISILRNKEHRASLIAMVKKMFRL